MTKYLNSKYKNVSKLANNSRKTFVNEQAKLRKISYLIIKELLC